MNTRHRGSPEYFQTYFL